MKQLHRSDLFSWSGFDPDRNIDFHGLLWVRDGGNIAVDPMPMSPHDEQHLLSLGELKTIVITNSDHVRDAKNLAEQTGARIVGPADERDQFPIACADWIGEGDEVAPGLLAFALDGSKTPGELALLLEGSTLITGDLIRAHAGGQLCMLPDAKLADRGKAIESVKRMAKLSGIVAVLPGDGWPIFRGGGQALSELAAGL